MKLINLDKQHKKNSLLIIGGTGFLGKSILDFLINFNPLKINKIIIISRGLHKIKIYKNLKKKFKIKIITADILRVKKLPSANYIIYAAKLKNYTNDFLAVKNFLNLAFKYNFNSKILYISSGAVYGRQKNQIKGFKENYLKKKKSINFINSYKNKYASTKLRNENLFRMFGKKKLKVSIARCFSFVGVHLPQDLHYAAGNIIRNILNYENIVINGNYNVIRSYMYSEDLAKWLLKILFYSSKSCPTYNVGSNDVVVLSKLACMLGKRFNLKVKLKSKIYKTKLDKYIPNVSKAKKELNLKNTYSSTDAIIKTIYLLKTISKYK